MHNEAIVPTRAHRAYGAVSGMKAHISPPAKRSDLARCKRIVTDVNRLGTMDFSSLLSES